MLNTNEKKLVTAALKLLLSLDKGRSEPLIKLINKHRSSALAFMHQDGLDDIIVSANELITTAPASTHKARRRYQIEGLLERDNVMELVASNHSADALNLFARIGILQFDVIIDELFLPFTTDRYEQNIKILRDSRGGMKPGIHSEKIDPVFNRAFALRNKIRSLAVEMSAKPGD